MRYFISLLVLFWVTSAKATVYQIPIEDGFSASATVLGPAYGEFYPIQATLSVTFTRPTLPPLDPLSDIPSAWSFNVYANGQSVFFACGTNLNADCGYRYDHSNPSFTIYMDSEGTGEIGISNRPNVYLGYIVPLTSIWVDLPDGFTIAGVPELSTWIMMTLGLAGIALWRGRWASREIAER